MGADPNDLCPWELAALRQVIAHIHQDCGGDFARTFEVTGWAVRALRGTLDGTFIPQRALLRTLAANLGVTEQALVGRDPTSPPPRESAAPASRVSADEARELLNDFPATAALSWEKVRDGAHVAVHGAFFYDRDGHPVVVTPGEAALYDRAHALAHTVITQEAEVAALRTELARERAEHDHSCKALGVELQYTQERVAELHETLRAVARACTLPKDTTPAALPAQVEACIRDLSEQIERLTLAATDAEDALAGLVALKTAAARAYLEMDGGRTDAITPETDSGAEPRLALTFDLGGTEGGEPWQALVIYDAGMGTVPVTSGECCGTPLAAVASLREDLEPNHNDDTEDDCEFDHF